MEIYEHLDLEFKSCLVVFDRRIKGDMEKAIETLESDGWKHVSSFPLRADMFVVLMKRGKAQPENREASEKSPKWKEDYGEWRYTLVSR